MGQKDFRGWRLEKEQIHAHHVSPFFHEQEIWWCAVGVNVGTEEDGKNKLHERPVLIFRKFSKDLFWGIPMTSKIRTGTYYHVFVLFDIKRTAMINQMRILSGKRLIRRISKMSDAQFASLEESFYVLLKRTPSRESSGA